MKAFYWKAVNIPELNAEDDNHGVFRCPECSRKLQWRRDGLVCQNWKCSLYWRRGGVFFSNRPCVEEVAKK